MQLYYALEGFLNFVNNWWWVLPPFILWKPTVFLYLWWLRTRWLMRQSWIVLEIKMPKNIVKPIRAMEVVLEGMWQMYDDPNPREKWFEGKVLLSYSFDIISIEGEIHFFIRTPVGARHIVEAQVYSQYPEAEISEAKDYWRYVPQDVPNKEWDLWGWDYKLKKANPIPIRTYTTFETEHEALEEKRIDPLASLLEGMGKFGPGEQLWIQIIACPIRSDPDPMKGIPWVQEGEALRDQLARRTKKPVKQKSIFVQFFDLLIFGILPTPATQVEEREVLPPEMKLTPGEKEVLAAVERKVSKLGFECTVRFIYLGKKEVFKRAKVRLPMSYFTNFMTENMNGFVPISKSITKSHTVLTWFLDTRRAYLRKRKIFRNYVNRFSTFFPRPGGTFVLNTEELATIYHFPTQLTAPSSSVSRVESTKKGPPADLPVELEEDLGL